MFKQGGRILRARSCREKIVLPGHRLSFRAAVLLWVAGAAAAALRPLDADIRPAGNRAVVVYKTTPQGELKVNLYFRPDWRAADRKPAMIFFFGGSCATGNPTEFAATAE
jgi:hypothetical protein